ncbi:MAG: hypothetical protein IKY57_00705 [Alistipes sp.]|nr:hypothetical protein [Alistipes sp.]
MRGVGRIVVMVVAMVACSCLAPQNTQMVGVNVRSWSKADSLIYDNNDTLALRDINIAIRYNDNFELAELPLKVAVTTPDARHFEEVIKLKINHPRTALTIATTESLPYRSNVVLAQKGEYIFAFTPLAEVRGVEAIGIEFREIAE